MSEAIYATLDDLTDEKRDALAWFMEMWWGDTLLYDIATSLSCGEADAMADLLRAFGHDRMADQFIEAHAEGDDQGDRHHPDYSEEDDT